MDTFQQTGEAMLLAHEGQRQIARMIEMKLRTWLAELKAWHGAMPTTLPPTEFQPH